MLLSSKTNRVIALVAVVLIVLFGVLAAAIQTRARQMQQAGGLRYGEAVQGSVSATAGQDWNFTGAGGDVLRIELTRSTGDLVASVALLDSDGQTIAATQGNPTDGKAVLFGVRLVQPGAYIVRVGSQSGSGAYSLLVTNTAPAPVTVTPSGFGFAGTLEFGKPSRGAIRSTVFEQVWRFRGAVGDVVDIRMVAISGDLDSYFTVVSPNNDFIGANDSADGGKDAGLFSLTLPQAGVYTLTTGRGGGSRAVTQGEYEITITLKTPNRGDNNTVLPIGGSLSGRLNRAGPVAEYRIEQGGILAFYYDLRSLHRLARAQILDNTGTILATQTGTAPLWFNVTLPDKGPYYLRLSSDVFDDQQNADFTITSYKLAAPAKPLRIGETQFSGDAGQARWYFAGRAGDLIRLSIKPNRGALNRDAVIRGPGDVVLFQGNLSPQFDQPLTLPATGLYQITVEADRLPPIPEYAVRVDLFGVNGIAFARYPSGSPRGMATFDRAVTGTTNPSESWQLDAEAGTTLNLTVQGTTSIQQLGVMVRAPDDTLLGAASGAGGALLRQVQLPRDGRYTIVVFDPTGANNNPYTLDLEEASGGTLPLNRTVKGFVLPSNAYAEWTLDVQAGTLVNARLNTRTPGIWSPGVYLIDPVGELVGRAFTQPGAATVNLLGIEAKLTGRYRIVVAGVVGAAFASYELALNTQPLFNTEQPLPVNAGERDPLPRFNPAPTPPTRPPQIADLIAPPIPINSVFGADIQSLPANTLLRGELTAGTLQQAWRIVANANATISLQATALSGTISPQLTLINRDGKVIAEELRGSGTTTTLTYRVVQAGDYALVVRIGLQPTRYTLFYQATNLRSGPLTVVQGVPLVYGQTRIGEMTTPRQSDTWFFYGASNDVITVRAWRQTGDFVPALQIETLGGRILGTNTNSDGKSEAAVEAVRVAESGVYAIKVLHGDTEATTSGRYLLALDVISSSKLKNRIGGVLEAGSTVTGALILADAEDTWLLPGRAGESLTLSAAALDPASEPTPLTLRLQDSAGNTFAVRDSFLAQDVARLENIILPADGIYRVVVFGGNQTQGGYRLTREPEQQRSQPYVISYGQTVGGVFSADRNAELWTFTGNAGDVISVFMSQTRGDAVTGGFQILSEDGLTLATAIDAGDGTGARVETIVLPFTASYTILAANPQADFKGQAVYAVSLSLQESTARNIGGILRPEVPQLGELFADDPTDQWLISGRAGALLDVDILPRDQFLKPSVRLKDRSGKVITERNQQTGRAISAFPLPADGAYIVEVFGLENTVGSYVVGIQFAPPAVSEIPPIEYGNSVAGLIADDRIEDVHIFQGRAGDVIDARANREPGSPLSLVLELYDPAGVLVARSDALGSDDALIENFRLPLNGRYRLVATRINGAAGRTSGRINISLNADAANFPIRGKLSPGQRGIGRLDDANPVERWTYEGKANEVIGIISRATSGDLDTTMTVIAPTGETLASNDDPRGSASTDAVIAGVTLPADGTYTVILSRVGTRQRGSAGNYEIRADRVYTFRADTLPPSSIGYGERVVSSINQTADEARYVFIGDAGDTLNLTLIHTTDDAPPILSIQDPTGAVLATGTLRVGQTVIDSYVLPIRAVYIVSVKRPINARTAYTPFTLNLNLLRSAFIPPATGGTLFGEDSVIGVIDGVTTSNQWTLFASAGQAVTLDVIPLSGSLRPGLSIIAPDGNLLLSRRLPPNAATLTAADVKLPQTGTYVILVEPFVSTQTGNYRLTIRTAQPATQPTPIPSETPVAGVLNDARPIERYTITLQANDKLSVRVLAGGSDLVPLIPTLELRQGEQIIAQSTLERSPLGNVALLDTIALPTGGDYELVVRREVLSSGTYTLFYSTRGVSTALTAARSIRYGTLENDTVLAMRPALYRFIGRKGDAVNLIALAGKTKIAPGISLQDSTGTVLKTVEPGTTEAAITGFTLPADGNYVVALSAPRTAAYTFFIQRRQDDNPTQLTGRTLVTGSNQENGLQPALPVNYWTISGKVGQRVGLTLRPVNSPLLRLEVSIFAPDGTFVAGATATKDGDAVTIAPFDLPGDGNYQIVVGRWLGARGSSTGRYTIRLENP
jgi:hypothetical protein